MVSPEQRHDLIDACKKYVDELKLCPHVFSEKVLTKAVDNWLIKTRPKTNGDKWTKALPHMAKQVAYFREKK